MAKAVTCCRSVAVTNSTTVPDANTKTSVLKMAIVVTKAGVLMSTRPPPRENSVIASPDGSDRRAPNVSYAFSFTIAIMLLLWYTHSRKTISILYAADREESENNFTVIAILHKGTVCVLETLRF